jgi:hypothetical protein
MATPTDPGPETKADQRQLEEKFSDELTPTPAPDSAEMPAENPEDSDATKAVNDPDEIARAIRESPPER